MKVKLMCRIRKKRRGLYCIWIVVDRETLFTNARMFVYINLVLFQTCELHILIILLYKNSKQIHLLRRTVLQVRKKQTRPFDPQRGDCIGRGQQTKDPISEDQWMEVKWSIIQIQIINQSNHQSIKSSINEADQWMEVKCSLSHSAVRCVSLLTRITNLGEAAILGGWSLTAGGRD